MYICGLEGIYLLKRIWIFFQHFHYSWFKGIFGFIVLILMWYLKPEKSKFLINVLLIFFIVCQNQLIYFVNL